MTREEAKSCICTIKMLQRLAYNIHGVMDVIDADNCKKIIKALEQEAVLDEIKDEIKQLTSRYTISRERGGMGQVEWEDRLIKEADILHIIDKYKESEGKE